MKLAELKISLVEQFFDSASAGVSVNKLSEIFESLKRDVDCELLVENLEGSHSSEPSKAFAQFTKERNSTLAIIEDDNAMFSAVKAGTNIYYSVLTKEGRKWQKGDLKIVKDALRQAKNINDEVDFQITTL